MTSVSVVIPTLNEAAEIGALLDRIEAQDFKEALEIVVVDGGSSDQTAEIIKKRKSARLLTSAPGVSVQRNIGAAHATSDLLVFLDADTNPSKRFIRNVVAAYEVRPFAAACPWFLPATLRPDIHLVYGTLNSLFYLSQLRFHTGAGVCIVTPRKIFEAIGGFNETLHLGEDVDYLRRAAKVGRHRHLLLPLTTSARRFESNGVWRTAWFYAKISPALMFGDHDKLRTYSYPPIRKAPL